jgi:hypothetical protein
MVPKKVSGFWILRHRTVFICTHHVLPEQNIENFENGWDGEAIMTSVHQLTDVLFGWRSQMRRWGLGPESGWIQAVQSNDAKSRIQSPVYSNTQIVWGFGVREIISM